MVAQELAEAAELGAGEMGKWGVKTRLTYSQCRRFFNALALVRKAELEGLLGSLVVHDLELLVVAEHLKNRPERQQHQTGLR